MAEDKIRLGGMALANGVLVHGPTAWACAIRTPEGELNFEDGVSAPGKYVELRAEMDVLALISNCPQLNNPCNAYNPTPIEVLIWDGQDH